MEIKGQQLFLCAYSVSDEIIIRRITEEPYFKSFLDFSKNKIQIIMLGSNAVGWLFCSIPESPIYDGQIFIYITPEYRRIGMGTEIYLQAVNSFITIGCNWWTSYPASDITDMFVKAVGFDQISTNLYMEHDSQLFSASEEGIRMCRPEDYPTAMEIWLNEYAEMHRRIGLPYENRVLTEEERKEERDDFINNINRSFVIEQNTKIVGYGTLFDDNSGIGSIAVDRNYAGRGYGTRLSAFLTNESIRRGCKTPCLYCELGNNDALHVYQKIGYHEIKRETVAVKRK